MWKLIRRLLSAPRERSSGPDLRNQGLELAMEWDGAWHSPLRPRLRKSFGAADDAELDEVARECEEVMRVGHELVFTLRRKGTPMTVLEEEFREHIRVRYPWVSGENRERLLRQGLYYATKLASPSAPI